MRNYLWVIFFIISLSAYAQKSDSELLKNILLKSKDSMLLHVLKHSDSFRYQIIYTEINRDRHNIPHFTNHYLNVSEKLYFNPASTVKLPLAILSLEKLQTMKKLGVDKYTSMLFDSSYSGQVVMYADSTSET
ncbi:MAG: hypothetical protein ACO29O_03015, partial [Chitinophagaceae bacterium]